MIATALTVLWLLIPVEPRCFTVRVFDDPSVTKIELCSKPYLKATSGRSQPE